uniref:Tf2-1-like SH3-like domain-containing protein n=1 Tax=Arundo donax TaxID=35708 RepID=A0A0A9CHQ3_ARUDO
MYLRCLTGDRPKQWLCWLPWAKYCFNTAYHLALKDSPFKIIYGRSPPSLCSADRGEAQVPAVEQYLKERDEFLQDVREHLLQAQEQAKLYYDVKHTPVAFGVGDWVWLKLLHRPIASLATPMKGKLAPRFYGLFQIVERIGDVAYHLKLPKKAKIHYVFHVGVLKKFHGQLPQDVQQLPHIVNG